MSRPHPIGIHITLTDARGGTLIFWKGMDGAADRNIVDALNGDAETEEVVIELYDAVEFDSKISGCEPLTSVVLSGEEWRDLEGGGRLETFFGLLKGAGETIAAGGAFYLVAQVDLQTLELSHRRLVFTAADLASESAELVEPGQARVALPVSVDRSGPLSQESALLGRTSPFWAAQVARSLRKDRTARAKKLTTRPRVPVATAGVSCSWATRSSTSWKQPRRI